MNKSLVSIIIPTYNRAHLIGETLDSVLAQTYSNWECIIIDDRSDDNTEEVVDGYVKKDSRFQYHERPTERPKGGNASRNYGFELSKGKYVKWFDSDDIMHPNFLEKQVEVLELNLKIDFCSSLSKMFVNTINEDLGMFKPNSMADDNAVYNFIIGKLYFLTPSTLWRKSLLNNVKLFDENLYRGQEADFNFRRLTEGAKFHYLKDVLFYVRRGHQSIESQSINDPKSIQSQFDYFQKIYFFLNMRNSVLSDFDINQLKKYVIYRQTVFFYNLCPLLKFSQNLKNFKKIFKNLLKIKLNIFDFFRVLLGIIIILFLKKGYSLIHIKSFDIRDRA